MLKMLSILFFLISSQAMAQYSFPVQRGINNAVQPENISTNLSGAWTIALGQSEIQEFYQTGAITNTVVVYDTNKVTLAEILIYADGNEINWPTNNVVWKTALPQLASNEWHSVIFRAHRGEVQAFYLNTYE
jgi:hypothetical protein